MEDTPKPRNWRGQLSKLEKRAVAEKHGVDGPLLDASEVPSDPRNNFSPEEWDNWEIVVKQYLREKNVQHTAVDPEEWTDMIERAKQMTLEQKQKKKGDKRKRT